MKKNTLLFITFFLLSFLVGNVNLSAQDYALSAPFGYGASATGGTGGTVVTVTTMSDLIKAANKSTTKKIILVSGKLTCSSMQTIQDAKNLTIIGLPGSSLENTQRNASGSGILNIKRTSNLILRNLTFKSAGAYDCDGSDNLCFEGVTNAWVDHCDFQDGVDGNFDNKGNTDNVTISWCRFRYLIAPLSGGSGGSDDHRFTNLLGSSSSDKPADGRYNITWAYCWWDEGCKERMVRGRNADLHFLNCYWNSSVANYYIGPENLKAYVEGCYFGGKPSSSNIFKGYGGTNAFYAVGSYGKNGLPSNGKVDKPSYSTPTVLTYENAKTAVSNSSCGAGATLLVNASTGAVSSSCNASEPTITLTTPATASQTVTQGTAIQEINYVYGGTATGFSVTYSGAATSKPSWLTYNNGKFTGTPTGYTANKTLTIKIKSVTSGGAASKEELTATINIIVPAPGAIALTSGTATQTAYVGNPINKVVYTYSGGATGATITGLPAGVTAQVNNTNKTVTISGTPTTTGTFNFTAKATGGQTEPSLTGTITVSTPTTLAAPVASVAADGTVTWAAVPNAGSYMLRHCSSSGSSGTTNKVWDMASFSSYESISTNFSKDSLNFYVGSKTMSIATTNKAYSDGFTSTYELKSGGSSNESNNMPTQRYLTFAVDGPVKIKAWFRGSGTGDRTLLVSNGTNLIGEATSTDQTLTIGEISYGGAATTLYVYFNNGVNIAKLTVEPAAATSCTEVAANSGYKVPSYNATTSTISVKAKSGNIAYLDSDYATATAATVKVNAALSLASATQTAEQTAKTGDELAAIIYNYTGTPSISWGGTANTTTAPAGINVNINATQIVITGTPTAAGNFSYTVSAAGINGGTNASSLSGTIKVSLAPVNGVLTLSSTSASAIVSAGGSVDIEYDYAGATPIVTWTGTANAATAPAGISVDTGDNYISISGTATVAGTYGYSIQVNGLNGGSNATAQTGTITVNPALITPANVVATSTANSVSLSWDANGEATSFKAKLCKAGEGGAVKSWDFSSWTITAADADANLVLDVAAGANQNKRFNYAPTATSSPEAIVFKNGTAVPDLEGLKIQQGGGSKLRLGFATGQVYLNGTGIKVEIPTQANDIVTIVGPAGSNTTNPDTRGYSVVGGTIQASECVNVDANGIMNVTGAVGTWVYKATGTSLTITTVVGGMNINSISVASGAVSAPICDEEITTSNSITFTDLDNNTEYTYSVQAIRNSETTNYSAEQKITTKTDDTPQAASISLTSAAGTNAQTVAVGQAITPISYSYTGSAATIAWSSVAPAGISGTTDISGTPTAAGSYNYTITVEGINGGASAQASGSITVLAALTVPSNAQATAGQNSLELAWDAVEGADKYIVNLCHDVETANTGSEEGKSLTYTVSGATWANASTASSLATGEGITIAQIGTEGKTSLLKIGNSNAGLSLSSTGNDAILITSTNAEIASIVLSFRSENTTAATPYVGYSTSAAYTIGEGTFNANNGCSMGNSNATTTSTGYTYAAPVGTKGIIIARGHACGDIASNAQSFQISKIEVYLKDTTGGTTTTSDCDTYETGTNSITIADLTAETEYTYQVKAVRGTEETAYSTAGSITTLANAPEKVNPTTPSATAIYGETLADVELPTGWTWDDAETTSVGDAGSKTFNASFAENELHNAASNVAITVVVSAKSITKPILNQTTFTYDGTAKSVTLATTNAAYALGATSSATNAGSYTASVTLTSTTNYKWADDTTAALSLTWTIAKATVSAPQATLAATYGQTLADVTLPTGWTWANTTTSVGNAGSNSFPANYAGDVNHNVASNINLTVNVSAASIVKPALSQTEFTYDGTAKSVTLATTNAAYTLGTTNSATNVGNYTASVTLTSTTNYKWTDDTTTPLSLTWAIAKANITNEQLPVDLTATEGQKLSDVSLPAGWTWVNPNTTIDATGTQSYPANYAGNDNYNRATNVDVTIEVSATSGVELQQEEKIKVYQQGDMLKIKGNILSSTIYNTMGALIKQQNAVNEIDLSMIPSGIYFIKMETIKGRLVTVKFMWK